MESLNPSPNPSRNLSLPENAPGFVDMLTQAANKGTDKLIKESDEISKITKFLVQDKAQKEAVDLADRLNLHTSASTIAKLRQKQLIFDSEITQKNLDDMGIKRDLEYDISCVDNVALPKPGSNEENEMDNCILEKRYGANGNYIKCSNTVKKGLLKNINNELTDRYKILRSFGGGKSGAYVFLVRDRFLTTEEIFNKPKDHDDPNDDKKSLKVFKLYGLEVFNAIQDRAKREIFTTCALSGTIGCPKVFEYGTTHYKARSPFWGDFEKTYIKCVGTNKWKFEPYQLYNNAYFVVTSISPGATLDGSDINLFKLQPQQMFSIIYQLKEIFSNIYKKIPTFIHNDLHPGNVFIDIHETYQDWVTMTTKESSLVMGPKVNIIDFDLVVSTEYPENLAKGREKLRVLPQEALLKLLMKWFGTNNTWTILDITKDIGGGTAFSLVKNNDDVRTFVIYKIMFEIFIFYKAIFGDLNIDETELSNQALNPNIVKLIILIIKSQYSTDADTDHKAIWQTCTNVETCTKDYFQGYFFGKWTDMVYNNFFNIFGVDYDKEFFKKFFISAELDMRTQNAKLLEKKHGKQPGQLTQPEQSEQVGPAAPPKQKPIKPVKPAKLVVAPSGPSSEPPSADTLVKKEKNKDKIKRKINKFIASPHTEKNEDAENFMSNYIEEYLNIGSGSPLYNVIGIGAVFSLNTIFKKEMIKAFANCITKIEKNIYDETNKNFGLHNFKIIGTINLGKNKITIPIYTKSFQNHIEILPFTINEDMIIQFSYDNKTNIKIDVNNIKFNIESIINQISSSSGLLGRLFLTYGSPLIIQQLPKHYDISINLEKASFLGSSNVPKNIISYLKSIIDPKLEDALICPGLDVPPLSETIEELYPMIQSILQFLLRNKIIPNLEVILQNNPSSNDEHTINCEPDFDFYDWLNNLHKNIDDEISKSIIEKYAKENNAEYTAKMAERATYLLEMSTKIAAEYTETEAVNFSLKDVQLITEQQRFHFVSYFDLYNKLAIMMSTNDPKSLVDDIKDYDQKFLTYFNNKYIGIIYDHLSNSKDFTSNVTKIKEVINFSAQVMDFINQKKDTTDELFDWIRRNVDSNLIKFVLNNFLEDYVESARRVGYLNHALKAKFLIYLTLLSNIAERTMFETRIDSVFNESYNVITQQNFYQSYRVKMSDKKYSQSFDGLITNAIIMIPDLKLDDKMTLQNSIEFQNRFKTLFSENTTSLSGINFDVIIAEILTLIDTIDKNNPIPAFIKLCISNVFTYRYSLQESPFSIDTDEDTFTYKYDATKMNNIFPVISSLKENIMPLINSVNEYENRITLEAIDESILSIKRQISGIKENINTLTNKLEKTEEDHATLAELINQEKAQNTVVQNLLSQKLTMEKAFVAMLQRIADTINLYVSLMYNNSSTPNMEQLFTASKNIGLYYYAKNSKEFNDLKSGTKFYSSSSLTAYYDIVANNFISKDVKIGGNVYINLINKQKYKKYKKKYAVTHREKDYSKYVMYKNMYTNMI